MTMFQTPQSYQKIPILMHRAMHCGIGAIIPSTILQDHWWMLSLKYFSPSSPHVPNAGHVDGIIDV
jgi:hypothetical protein